MWGQEPEVHNAMSSSLGDSPSFALAGSKCESVAFADAGVSGLAHPICLAMKSAFCSSSVPRMSCNLSAVPSCNAESLSGSHK